MSLHNAYESSDARFATFVDEDGNPPCVPPDACPSCLLFDRQRPDESRAEWLARITRQAIAACKWGHALTEANVYRRPDGEIRCRACNRAAGRAYVQRRKSS